MKHLLNSCLLLLVSLGLAACSSSNGTSQTTTEKPSSDATDTKAYTEIQLDSAATAAYLNLLTGEQVTETDTWHLKADRLNIQLNTGVTAALAVAQEHFYSAAGEPETNMFSNANADEELAKLLGFTNASTLSFVADELRPAIAGLDGWYRYDFTSHTVSAASDVFWLVRSSFSDSYAKVRATGLVQNGREFTTTFEFDLQAAGSTAFAGATSSRFSVSNQAAPTCFDFDAGVTSPCDELNWDIAMIDGELVVNGGASGDGAAAAFGPIDLADSATYTNGTHSAGVNFTAAYRSDQIAGALYDSPWYTYNLLGNHQIWPNYRVYVVDTDSSSNDDEQVKIQIINYYDQSGKSGYVSLRFLPLSKTGDES